jgi:hypothetical protein
MGQVLRSRLIWVLHVGMLKRLPIYRLFIEALLHHYWLLLLVLSSYGMLALLQPLEEILLVARVHISISILTSYEAAHVNTRHLSSSIAIPAVTGLSTSRSIGMRGLGSKIAIASSEGAVIVDEWAFGTSVIIAATKGLLSMVIVTLRAGWPLRRRHLGWFRV